jgi:hypothetical protein
MTIRLYSGSYLPLSGGTLSGGLTIVGNLVATNVQGTNNVNTTGGGAFFWTSKSALTSASDGVIMLSNNAQTDFSRIQLGGTTSSFPAIKRSGPAATFRRADDTIGTFANLPAAAAGNEGAIYPISDSSTATWGATITGGGANHVLAYSNGSNWTVAAI